MESVYDFCVGAAVCFLFAVGFASLLFLMEGMLHLVHWLRDRWRWLKWFSWQ